MIFCLLVVPAASVAPPSEGFGLATGMAKATYVFRAPGGPRPPEYKNDGYAQTVSGADGEWIVRVEVNLTPLRVRTPFRPGMIPDVGLPQDLADALSRSLAPCKRADEAVDAVLLFFKRNIRYAEKPGGDESLEHVFARREASCVGLTRAACAVIGGLGIPCREVVGLKVPPGTGRSIILEGGKLHAWIEVDYPGTSPVFCDVLTSSGWVGARYILLKRGEGLDVGSLARLKSGTVTCVESDDQVFFEPKAGLKCVLWARPSTDSFTGALVSGKFLTREGEPVPGRATLMGQNDSASMELWEGNFFFRDLEPGGYRLLLEPEGHSPMEKEVLLSTLDKRYLIFYCCNDGRKGRSAN